jgi:hypothetical protein
LVLFAETFVEDLTWFFTCFFICLYTLSVCLSVCTFVCLTKSYLSSLNFRHVLTLFPEAKYIKMKSRKTHFEFIVRWSFSSLLFGGQKKVNQVFSFRAFSGFYCIQWFNIFLLQDQHLIHYNLNWCLSLLFNILTFMNL